MLAGLSSCRSPTESLPFPAGAVLFRPDDAAYRSWWRGVERCAGRAGNYDAISWYLAPGDSMFTLPGHPGPFFGIWYSDGNRIVLVKQAATWNVGVRHEMLHALLHVGTHPREYFLERCRGVVYCGDNICSDSPES